jgi:hypothetical protein
MESFRSSRSLAVASSNAILQGGEGREVRKRSFLAIFYIKRSFYQDRLGTNIGKVLKKETVFL